MKKKILSIIGIFVLLFSITGCMKFNVTMEIRKDKSMDFSIIYAMNKSVLEMNQNEENSGNQSILSEEEKQDMINQGFTVIDYDDGDNKGFQMSKKISNIDDYSSETDTEYDLSGITENNNNTKIFKIIKGNGKNTYIANFKFDASESNLAAEEENDEAIVEDNSESLEIDESEDFDITSEGDLSQMSEAMMSSMDLKFTVKLPNPVITSNATTISEDKKELTWDLTKLKNENIKFEFEINEASSSGVIGNNLFSNIDSSMIIAIIALTVGVISLVLVIIYASKKNKKNVE